MPQQTGIKWLLEQNVFEDGNPERLAEIIRANGMTSAQVAYACVDGDVQRLKPVKPVPFQAEEAVFVYGSMNLCSWLRWHRQWPKLAWYDFDRLRCQIYYAQWGRFLLQQDHAFLTLAEVNRKRDRLFETFGQDGRIFIRPDDNTKSFAGGVVGNEEFEKWWELANFYNPGPDCLAVVARPQTIHAEWRLVIGNRRVVTGSKYRSDGRDDVLAGCPPEVSAFAETVASATEFEPHPMYVMDIANTDNGYRLIEIGSVCCASLYACDLERVVCVVADIAKGKAP